MNDLSSVSGFGLDWEARLSAKRAQEITRDVPAPGFERLVARGVPDREKSLYLQNCAGILVLASSTTPVVHWERDFGSEWARYSLAAQRQAQQAVEKSVFAQLQHFFDTTSSEIDLSAIARYAPRYDWGGSSCSLDALTAAAMAFGRDRGLPLWGETVQQPEQVRERG